jgi:hypothetical protein
VLATECPVLQQSPAHSAHSLLLVEIAIKHRTRSSKAAASHALAVPAEAEACWQQQHSRTLQETWHLLCMGSPALQASSNPAQTTPSAAVTCAGPRWLWFCRSRAAGPTAQITGRASLQQPMVSAAHCTHTHTWAHDSRFLACTIRDGQGGRKSKGTTVLTGGRGPRVHVAQGTNTLKLLLCIQHEMCRACTAAGVPGGPSCSVLLQLKPKCHGPTLVHHTNLVLLTVMLQVISAG